MRKNVIQETDEFKRAQRELEGRCQHCGKPSPDHHFRCVDNIYYESLTELLDEAVSQDNNLAVTLREVIDNQRDV